MDMVEIIFLEKEFACAKNRGWFVVTNEKCVILWL